MEKMVHILVIFGAAGCYLAHFQTAAQQPAARTFVPSRETCLATVGPDGERRSYAANTNNEHLVCMLEGFKKASIFREDFLQKLSQHALKLNGFKAVSYINTHYPHGRSVREIIVYKPEHQPIVNAYCTQLKQFDHGDYYLTGLLYDYSPEDIKGFFKHLAKEYPRMIATTWEEDYLRQKDASEKLIAETRELPSICQEYALDTP